jgi:hypothetical protein
MTFTAYPTSDSGAASRSITVARAADAPYDRVLSTVTDAQGRANAFVSFGSVPGKGRVVVAVPTANLVDTVAYTVTPGNATRITLRVPDTVAYAGVEYDLGLTSFDRLGNPGAPPPSIEVVPPSIASATPSGRIRTVREGHARVVLRLGKDSVVSSLDVPPPGTVLALDWDHTVFLSDLDGSHYRRVPGPTYTEMRWLPDGRFMGWSTFIYVVDTLGARVQLTTAAQFEWVGSPRVAAGYIFFSGKPVQSQECFLYRIRFDGTGLERLPTPPHDNCYYPFSFSIAPDASYVIYRVNNFDFHRWDLATQHDTPLGVRGQIVEISPDGQLMAYAGVYDPANPYDPYSGQMNLVVVRKIDGTDPRVSQFSVPRCGAFQGLSWSPDSKWVVAKGTQEYAVLPLIRAETGEMAIPLFIYGRTGVVGRAYWAPAWKP